MHEGACKRNGAIEFLMWSAGRPSVSNCPFCKVRIEKIDGCNSMHCNRCQGHFCWICRRNLKWEGYDHFEPWNLIGCPGQQDTGGRNGLILGVLINILLVIFMPAIILFAPPVVISNTIKDEFGYQYRHKHPINQVIFGFTGAMIGLIVGCIGLVVILPFVEIYQVFKLLKILISRFLCCCCI